MYTANMSFLKDRAQKLRVPISIACSLLIIQGCDDGSSDPDAGVDADVDVARDAEGDSDVTPEADVEEDADWPDVIERPLYCPGTEDLAALVDPMIGTDGSGNVIPGALVPHGMVRASPDTNVGEARVDAYDYEDGNIVGFTHTHLQGPGGSANGYSHILIMPRTGSIETEPEVYLSSFSHETEEAEPGYYSVMLAETGIRAELTATTHAAMHRYTFPESASSHVLVDLGHSRGVSKSGEVTISPDGVIRGHGVYNVHPMLDILLSSRDDVTGGSTVYFHAVFDPPFANFGTWGREGRDTVVREGSLTESGEHIGAYLTYDTSDQQVVEVRVGISLVSEAQARRNLDIEIGERSFEDVRTAARRVWNCYLNRVIVDGGTEAERTMFYTALYHTLFQPADYTEVGGVFWSGADGVGEVFHWPQRRFFTDDWCAWDTFRTSRPLSTLVEPEVVGDVVASYLHLYEQGGWLPKCTWHASGYSRVMIGNHAVPIIADALVKGLVDSDVEQVWEAIYHSAVDDNLDELPGTMLCGYLNLGTSPDYRDLGYVSHECDEHQSVSMTLEYAYNDWCIARVAEALDRQDDLELFTERSGSYVNHWDSETGFMRGRMRDGSWVEPFDPASTDDSNDFCEASAWIYSWFVPHDVAGLVELFGGEEAFLARLDQFFDEGHFEPSNEPSFHVPFLYNFVGAPERTQEMVRGVLNDHFADTPDGLPGNDDAGATSAWYVFAAMGLYPLAPGDGIYQLSSPLFDRVEIRLDPDFYAGDPLVIEAHDNSPDNVYVMSAELNGHLLDRWWVHHEEIVTGGTLSFQMGPVP